MKQYCVYCAFCVYGDVFFCTKHDVVLSESKAKHINQCASYAESELGHVETGKRYKPRKEKENDGVQIRLGD